MDVFLPGCAEAREKGVGNHSTYYMRQNTQDLRQQLNQK